MRLQILKILIQKMIILQPFKEEDFDRLISWISDEKLLIQFAGSKFQFPLSHEQLKAYCAEAKRNIFKVISKESSEVVGHAEVYQIAEDTVLICRVLIGAPQHRGKGLGTALMKELIAFAEQDLGIKNIELNVFEWNLPAIACYQKLGFKKVPDGDRITRYGDEHWRSIRMRLTATES